MAKSAFFWVPSFWYNTGVWRTVGRGMCRRQNMLNIPPVQIMLMAVVKMPKFAEYSFKWLIIIGTVVIATRRTSIVKSKASQESQVFNCRYASIIVSQSISLQTEVKAVKCFGHKKYPACNLCSNSLFMHLFLLNGYCLRSTWRITCTASLSLVTLQPLDFTCGTLFRSSCAIQTSAMDCLYDSWRDIFLVNHERGALWLLDMWRLRKTLTYLLTTGCRRLRSSNEVPRTRTDLGNGSFTVAGRRLLNTCLPVWSWTHGTGIPPVAEDTAAIWGPQRLVTACYFSTLYKCTKAT